MENLDDKFEKIIEKLRQQKPVLREPGLLTDNIMQQIEANSRKYDPRLLIFIRAVSSSAAILLVGVFLFQQSEFKTFASTNIQTQLFDYKMNIDSLCIENRGKKKLNLLKTYICHLQQNSIENNKYQTFIQQ